jgi:D-glycero-D-manno-heptose 1,7-bisphosphate phosphatase
VSGRIPEGFPDSWEWHPLPLGIASAVATTIGGTFDGALLLDRDGTLIEDGDFLADPARVVLVPEALVAIERARAKRWAVGMISNQGGIGLQRFSWSDAAAVHDALVRLLDREGIALDVALMSPFHPEGEHPEFGHSAPQSRGRKPEPGMIELAVQMLRVQGDVLVVGDKTSDIAAANAAGVEAIQVPRRDAGVATRGDGGWERVYERLGADA